MLGMTWMVGSLIDGCIVLLEDVTAQESFGFHYLDDLLRLVNNWSLLIGIPQCLLISTQYSFTAFSVLISNFSSRRWLSILPPLKMFQKFFSSPRNTSSISRVRTLMTSYCSSSHPTRLLQSSFYHLAPSIAVHSPFFEDAIPPYLMNS